MKFYFTILLFFILSGCSISPFKSPKKESHSHKWHHNRLKTTVDEEFEWVFKKVEQLIIDLKIKEKKRSLNEDQFYLELEDLKIYIKPISPCETQLIIKTGILVNQNLAETLMEKVICASNSIEYDKKGSPVN